MTALTRHEAMKAFKNHKGYGLFTLTAITLFAMAWGWFIINLVTVH